MDFRHPVAAVIPGAQGHILQALALASSELSVRALARVCGVSAAQTSRVMPGLVSLGLVERREVPPSALFRLNRDHVAAPAILMLAKAHDVAIERLREAARKITVAPINMTLFGSLARGEADAESDADVLVVRPDELSEDDVQWSGGMDRWRDIAEHILGNDVNLLEVSRSEAQRRMGKNTALWRNIEREGIVLTGRALSELR